MSLQIKEDAILKEYVINTEFTIDQQTCLLCSALESSSRYSKSLEEHKANAIEILITFGIYIPDEDSDGFKAAQGINNSIS